MSYLPYPPAPQPSHPPYPPQPGLSAPPPTMPPPQRYNNVPYAAPYAPYDQGVPPQSHYPPQRYPPGPPSHGPPPGVSNANSVGPASDFQGGPSQRYDHGPHGPPPSSNMSGPNGYPPHDRPGGPPGGRRDGPRRNAGRGRSPDGRREPRRLGPEEREQRSNNEKWCRTLFVRNVSYDADIEWLRTSFSSYGDVKEFFDLISKRGLIFVTYFDLRAAERARQAMHGTQVQGRAIDVHFSLPRDEDVSKACTKDKNQGSILVTVRGNRQLNEMELGKMCEQFGEVRSVRSGRGAGTKIVEFWDSRGAVLFFEQMNNQHHQGGPLTLRFVWDEPDPNEKPGAPAAYVPPQGQAPPGRAGHGRNHGRDRGPPSPVNRNRHGPPPGRDQSGPGHQRRRSGGYGGDRRGSYGEDRNDRGDPRDPYAPQDRYREAPPSGPPVGDDRLEQARRVQDLLATLGGAVAPTPAPAPVPASYPPARPPFPPNSAPPNYSAPPPPQQYNARPPPAPTAPTPPPVSAYGSNGNHSYNQGPPPPRPSYNYNGPPGAPVPLPGPPGPPAPPGPPGGYGGYSNAPPAQDPRLGYAPSGQYGAPPPPPPPAPATDVSSLLAMLKK
ncbi:hypothetical protein DB88DRAFT_498925 [Papiliotrema laurentii]|uniref:RRM domain-containing protein n=1 Tax=Papiliotrema laurentii TaxID=5418 RepID=A0AAD9FJL2_PAPLA|nr:hypothetical protein DB88DRAFT_498925 [Papiliotrema laurentii]